MILHEDMSCGAENYLIPIFVRRQEISFSEGKHVVVKNEGNPFVVKSWKKNQESTLLPLRINTKRDKNDLPN